ncbi:MAG: FAD-dependent oxidoreductase [Myxococcales bacterium]|nr:FAD-dependent oxidoreductase [Myxococcales bacterium]
MGLEAVIVIGAGLAGSSAAATLSEAGVRVTLLEAHACSGGRARALGAAHGSASPIPPALGLRGRLGMKRLGRVAARFRAEPDERFDDRSVADFARLYLGERDGARFSRWFESQWLQPAAETSRACWRELLAAAQAPPRGLREPTGAEVSLQAGWPVSRIDRKEDGFCVAAVSGASRQADALILATTADVSAALIAKIADAAETRLLDAVRYVPVLGFRARLKRAPALHDDRVAAEGVRALCRVAIDAGSKELLAIASPEVAARQIDAPDAITGSVFEAALRAALPDGVCDFDEPELLRFPRGMPAFEVGHLRRMQILQKIATAERAAGRRLAYAGDFLHAPTRAGAVRSGVAAADALLDRRG